MYYTPAYRSYELRVFIVSKTGSVSIFIYSSHRRVSCSIYVLGWVLFKLGKRTMRAALKPLARLATLGFRSLTSR